MFSSFFGKSKKQNGAEPIAASAHRDKIHPFNYLILHVSLDFAIQVSNAMWPQ